MTVAVADTGLGAWPGPVYGAKTEAGAVLRTKAKPRVGENEQELAPQPGLEQGRGRLGLLVWLGPNLTLVLGACVRMGLGLEMRGGLNKLQVSLGFQLGRRLGLAPYWRWILGPGVRAGICMMARWETRTGIRGWDWDWCWCWCGSRGCGWAWD